ncbi:MAG: HNH endonuclease [Aquabacterium sp.]|nr:HNH endonuclease [Ferruginibacter sp.]
MEKNYPGEQWKPIVFNFDFVNETRIEVSSYGRIKTFNKVSKGNIIKGSMVNGYQIIRLKFFKAREDSVQKRLDYLQKQAIQLNQKIKKQQLALAELSPKDAAYAEGKKQIENSTLLLTKLRESVSKKFSDDLKSRTIYYQALIHRLVAEYFTKQPSPQHTLVAHIDYDKLNNNKSNLKWMTPDENYSHQRFSPNVIASKAYLDGRRKEDAKSTKLSVTKVMLMKKLINEGKPMKQLVKQFKVTETQILRIKRGENWAEVQAAP